MGPGRTPCFGRLSKGRMRAEKARNDELRRFAVAMAGVAFATLVRYGATPLVGARAPWVFYFPAVAFAGWRYGFGPAAFALVLSALAGWFLWVPPSMSFALKGREDTSVLLAFLLSGAVIVAFGRANERTRRRLSDESVVREQTARELTESLESFRSIFEHAQGDALILLDDAFRVQAWNPGAESIFGYSAEEALGRSVDFVFPLEEHGASEASLSRRSATESGFANEARWYRRKDGARFWGEGSLVALHSADDGVRGYVKILRDETSRRELETAMRTQSEALDAQVRERTADLRAANAELEGFTYSVSHDMRAPLRAIVGHARILMEDYAELLPEDAQERIERMSKASSRMGRLIEDLLTYARLNKQELRKQPVDLAQIFREVVAQESQGLPIDAYAPEAMPVMAEPGLMRMVLENLVGNAVKYRRPDVPLRLKFRLVDREGMCGYAVEDNGRGFEMRYAPKLFEPFERLHRTEEVEGTGIGLANVRRIVRRHGGDVWAEGEPGVGATFGFTLP